MDRIDLTKHLGAIFAGLIVLFWTLYLMTSPLKFALGLVLFLITFTCVELLLSGSWGRPSTESHDTPSRSVRKISGELLIAAVFVLSLVIILSVPAIEGEIFVEWSFLGLPNVARLIAAFGINFFPGYIVLAIVGNHELGKLSKLVTSYFLSLSMLTITAFVSAHVVGIVNGFFLKVFSFVCTTLILVYVLKHLLRRKPRSENKNNSVSFFTSYRRMLPTLLVGLTVAFMGVFLWWMYSSIGFFFGPPGSDMWRLNGAAQAFLDYKAFRWLYYPWWFDLYLSSFTVVSGVPSTNAYLALYPLMALPVLSFYLMTSVFFKNKTVASLATLSYAIFSGPAWLYALYLRDFNPLIGYDDWKSILYEASDKFLLQGRYPPFPLGFTGAVVGYASLWWMIYATWRLDVGRKFNFLLISITLAMSYLTHGIEPIIFVLYSVALLIACLLTHNNEDKKRVKWAASSVLAAIGIVALIDVSLTSKYDYFNSIVPNPNALASRYFYFNSPSFYLLAFASASLIVLTHGKFIENKFERFHQVIYNRLAPKYAGSLKSRLPEIIFYLYGISVVVFIILFPSLTIATTLFGSVPWYVYPVVGGIPSFLGLLGIAIALRKWNELEAKVRAALLFCALSVVLLFIFGQTISFVNERFFYTHFWERRTFAYISPMMSMLMAYALVTLFNRVQIEKPHGVRHIGRIGLVSVLTSLIIISSVSSTLIAGDFASVVFFVDRPTKDELEALKYLHYSLPEGVKIGYMNRWTGTYYIRAFANDKWTPDANQWLGQYYYSANRILSAIEAADIRFLYLNRIRDSPDLEKNLFIQQLIRVLPVEFNNSEVTIFSVPSLHFPSPTSPLGLISPKEKTGALYDAYTLWSLTLATSTYPYTVITDSSSPDVLNATKSILIPYDPPQIEEETGQLLEWVAKGGHLIVSNTNQFGICAEWFGLKTKISLLNCDSTDNWRTVYVIRGRVSVENAVKIEGTASLRLQNNLSSWEEYVYTPPDAWDLTQYEYLGIWVYGTGGGPLFYLWLTDSNGNETYYRLDLSIYESGTYVPGFTGWKLVLIPIEQYYGTLDLSAIKGLRIDTGYTMPVNILIDEIFALEEIEERPIVMIDGIKGATTIALPDIEVQSLNPNVDARIIANYTKNGAPVTPFAIQKDFGNGKMTYLNINPLYQSILSGTSGFTAPKEVLEKILEIVGVQS